MAAVPACASSKTRSGCSRASVTDARSALLWQSRSGTPNGRSGSRRCRPRRAPPGSRSPSRGLGMPTSRACRSTGSTTPATCSSGPPRVRPRHGRPPVRSPSGFSPSSASRCCPMSCRSGLPRRRRPSGRGPATSSASTSPRCGASIRLRRRRWSPRSKPRRRKATRWVAWSRCSPTACPWGSAATCTGTASSTRCSRRRS